MLTAAQRVALLSLSFPTSMLFYCCTVIDLEPASIPPMTLSSLTEAVRFMFDLHQPLNTVDNFASLPPLLTISA